jgi:hypothetical protein
MKRLGPPPGIATCAKAGYGLDRKPRAGEPSLHLLQPLRREAGHQSRGTFSCGTCRVLHHVIRRKKGDSHVHLQRISITALTAVVLGMSDGLGGDEADQPFRRVAPHQMPSDLFY